MPKFRVKKGHDAYAVYEAIIEADSVDQANEFAEADRFADIWQPTGEIREYDEYEMFVDETEQVPDETALEKMTDPLTLTLTERDTILAGLRALQDLSTMNAGELPDGLQDILTNGGTHPAMTEAEIDALCERINT